MRLLRLPCIFGICTIFFFSRLRLKHLEYDIEKSTTRLDKKIQVLDEINQQIQEAITENDRHLNAFNKFATIIMEKLVADVNAVKDILAELQRKECAKVIIKETVRITLYKHRHIKG